MLFRFIILWFMTISNVMAYDKDLIDRSKDIWKDYIISLYHQYDVLEAFRPINLALCTASYSDYKNWVNLNSYQDPVTKKFPQNFNVNLINDDFYFRGYKANLNDKLCGRNEDTYAQIFSAKQNSDSEPLELYSYRVSNTADLRTKFVITENASKVNPFGVLTYDYNIVRKSGSVPLYKASLKSERLDASTIQLQTVGWNDTNLTMPSIPAGYKSEQYVSKVIHSETSLTGYGTVHRMSWGGTNVSQNQQILGNYPDGIPDSVTTINFSYNNDYLLFKRRSTAKPTSVVAGFEEEVFPPSAEICLNRTNTWNYVPWWFGYGIYDEDGDRIAANANITVSYETNVDGYGVWNGNLVISGTRIANIPTVCRDMKDGSIVGGLQFCEAIGKDGGYPNATQNISLFDVPEGTVLTDNAGNEYYVRVLRSRKVFTHADASNCSGLQIQATLTTPDHKFLNYLNDSDVPPSGAVIINQYQPGDTINDPIYSGKVYVANQDDDSDGVLNYLDAFPDDSTKSKDDDYDGIADSIDNEVKQFRPIIEKYLNLELFSDFNH